MKTYKVLERHIGDDPLNPYVPGDDEFGTRSMPASEARALIALGLLGEIDEDLDGHDADADASSHGTEQLKAAHASELTVEQERTAAALAELVEAQKACGEATARADALAADLDAAKSQMAELETQLAASLASQGSGEGGSSQDTSEASEQGSATQGTGGKPKSPRAN